LRALQFFTLNRSLFWKAVHLYVVFDRAKQVDGNDIVVKTKVSLLLYMMLSHSKITIQGTVVFVPVDFTITVDQFKPVEATNANRLRPVNLQDPADSRRNIDLYNKGVEVKFSRSGIEGSQVRWIQTVTRMNSSSRTRKGLKRPLNYIDAITTTPFIEDSTTFTDTPCGPKNKDPAKVETWNGTASICVLTEKRVTLVTGVSYGFRIVPGSGHVAVTNRQLATADDYAKEVAILNVGVNSEWEKVIDNRDFRVPRSGLAVNPSLDHFAGICKNPLDGTRLRRCV
jgi:hypothetical protein